MKNQTRLKKDFDKKGSPSKQEVDNFNKAVNDINKASQAYNKTMNELNSMRKATLDNWNESTDAFYDANTPHYK